MTVGLALPAISKTCREVPQPLFLRQTESSCELRNNKQINKGQVNQPIYFEHLFHIVDYGIKMEKKITGLVARDLIGEDKYLIREFGS